MPLCGPTTQQTGHEQDALQEAVEEAERRRAAGENFTKAVYLAWRNLTNEQES